MAETKPGKLTARIVRKAVTKFAKTHELPLATKRATPRSDKRKAATTLGKLRAAIAALPDADRIAALLEKVKDLIG